MRKRSWQIQVGSNPVRIVDLLVDELDLVNLGFDVAIPAVTGQPAYHPEILFEDLYICLSQPHLVESTPGARSSTQR